MRFNKHYAMEGQHAPFGASRYHWVNYDLEKLRVVWSNMDSARLGDRYHAYAAEAIRLRQRQARNKKTVNAYINDAIGFRMEPEVLLFATPNFFGTADAIQYYEDQQLLRVHDLKTGISPTSFKQLDVYCAFFCIEYKLKPHDLRMIERIYQLDDMFEQEADPDEIQRIIDVIHEFDPIIESMKGGSL